MATGASRGRALNASHCARSGSTCASGSAGSTGPSGPRGSAACQITSPSRSGACRCGNSAPPREGAHRSAWPSAPLVQRQEREVALAREVPGDRLGELSRGREVDEAVGRVHRRAGRLPRGAQRAPFGRAEDLVDEHPRGMAGAGGRVKRRPAFGREGGAAPGSGGRGAERRGGTAARARPLPPPGNTPPAELAKRPAIGPGAGMPRDCGAREARARPRWGGALQTSGVAPYTAPRAGVAQW